MTTQGTMVEEFDSTTRDAVLLQIQGDLDCDGLLSPSDVIAGGLICRSRSISLRGDAQGYLTPTLYKGGSDQWFVTYELGPDTGDEGSCPQVTRVYLSGELCGWEIGSFATRSGTVVHGVKIEYERTHESYRARDEDTELETDGSPRRYAKIIEIPSGATHIALRSALPDRYRHALHRL
jgi:hypothetical protein